MRSREKSNQTSPTTQRPAPLSTSPGRAGARSHATPSALPARPWSHNRRERHRSQRTGWLRATVLGANDGLLSTASLVLGVAAGGAGRALLWLSGLASLVAGAFSMAAGEYTSVSSQRDAEEADLRKERAELSSHPEDELRELTEIYQRRGLSEKLAHRVAGELHAHDALAAHARDELGLDPEALAQPVQAAAVSFAAFAMGAVVPVLTIVLLPGSLRQVVTALVTLAALAGLGAVAARLGGADAQRGALRMAALGALAMAVTTLVGRLAGVMV